MCFAWPAQTKVHGLGRKSVLPALRAETNLAEETMFAMLCSIAWQSFCRFRTSRKGRNFVKRRRSWIPATDRGRLPRVVIPLELFFVDPAARPRPRLLPHRPQWPLFRWCASQPWSRLYPLRGPCAPASPSRSGRWSATQRPICSESWTRTTMGRSTGSGAPGSGGRAMRVGRQGPTQRLVVGKRHGVSPSRLVWACGARTRYCIVAHSHCTCASTAPLQYVPARYRHGTCGSVLDRGWPHCLSLEIICIRGKNRRCFYSVGRNRSAL